MRGLHCTKVEYGVRFQKLLCTVVPIELELIKYWTKPLVAPTDVYVSLVNMKHARTGCFNNRIVRYCCTLFLWCITFWVDPLSNLTNSRVEDHVKCPSGNPVKLNIITGEPEYYYGSAVSKIVPDLTSKASLLFQRNSTHIATQACSIYIYFFFWIYTLLKQHWHIIKSQSCHNWHADKLLPNYSRCRAEKCDWMELF